LRAAPATNADSRHDPCRTGRLSNRKPVPQDGLHIRIADTHRCV
jgi:hypothetical protein